MVMTMKNELKPCKSDAAYDAGQLAKGAKVEMEHTDLVNVAKTIAKHHLDEYPDYYLGLEHMENFLEKGSFTITAMWDKGEVTITLDRCKIQPDSTLECVGVKINEAVRNKRTNCRGSPR